MTSVIRNGLSSLSHLILYLYRLDLFLIDKVVGGTHQILNGRLVSKLNLLLLLSSVRFEANLLNTRLVDSILVVIEVLWILIPLA